MSRDQRERAFENLREEVEQAKAQYENAKAAQARALQRMHDLGVTHPDGSVRHAEMVYLFTFQKYMEALQRYNAYVLDRTDPMG